VGRENERRGSWQMVNLDTDWGPLGGHDLGSAIHELVHALGLAAPSPSCITGYVTMCGSCIEDGRATISMYHNRRWPMQCRNAADTITGVSCIIPKGLLQERSEHDYHQRLQQPGCQVSRRSQHQDATEIGYYFGSNACAPRRLYCFKLFSVKLCV
jgi:hypothetical protein